MKTELSKILSVSGQHGLYKYVAQARSGAIAENLETGKRMLFDLRSRMTTLSDISIFTSEGELKLKDVFLAIAKVTDSKQAPGPKSSDEELKDLFGQAVPDYDRDRFYVSHMRKVVDWYNQLLQFASLDFAEETSGERE